MMIRVRKGLLSGATLLAVTLLLSPALSIGANQPPKPGLLLGSHPTATAKNARVAFNKQRFNAISLKPAKPGKTVNSLNARTGKTLQIRPHHS
jgi:hypothetical protein